MRVDLRSDTVTRPTQAMREAMATAVVGDDVYGEDPTVNALEAAAAERLGKDAALYVPSGTMANQIAIRCHTEPGDEIIVEAGAHPFHYEAGGPAMISGVMVRQIPGTGGVLEVDQLRPHLRGDNDHFAPQRLVCAEDTANRGGGAVWPLEALDALAQAAHDHGAATHLDGARLFNAVVASGVPAARRVQHYDTVSFCLSKGLGAPVGSLLCGSRDVIRKARRVRKALGGGMRQAGIIAAAGLYALEHHVHRLADDHARARTLAEGLTELGFSVAPAQSNMVYVDVGDGPAISQGLAARDVLCSAIDAQRLRLVTHLDVDDDDIMRTLQAFAAIRS